MSPASDRTADFEDRVPIGSARRRLLIPHLQSQHAGDDRPRVLLTCDTSMRQRAEYTMGILIRHIDSVCRQKTLPDQPGRRSTRVSLAAISTDNYSKRASARPCTSSAPTGTVTLEPLKSPSATVFR